ncbi:FKBP-type peptidyl-prolyl cis-trans isomerase [Cytophagales bacterium LB-30]|uniref:Peptidyl-prolyl cis-trans isomerase n=1 Tax=Shiella aurantiaca TaxID=3058365 RepID=A0ABT8F253_9BACT|nr:FKBP-type peptidyl-prolyl cis-trans isomerase [Shiella aurantiaca]MDN4164527.1 FKBP-type peptidyl-prolyl cis-trans isomerase [Shiella aurantiaca]
MLNSILKKGSVALLGAAMMFACNSGGLETTSTGLRYTMVKKGDGPKPKDGEFVIMNLSLLNHTDSVIFSTATNGSQEVFQYYDSLMPKNGSIEEAISMLSKGDSITLKVAADSIYRGSMTPPGVTKGTDLTIHIGLADILDQAGFEAWQMAEYQKRQEKMLAMAAEQMAIDKALITDFLTEKGIEAQSTANGLYYVITQEGSGATPERGQKVTVHYKGTLLDGTPFDSSYDRGAPFTFTLGVGQVIRGWDEGLALLNKGAKATLYIPSPLAYGSSQRGPVIKPNSVLMFEVEMVDFE